MDLSITLSIIGIICSVIIGVVSICLAYNLPLKKMINFNIINCHYITNGYVLIKIKNVGIRKFVIGNLYVYYKYGLFSSVTSFYDINDYEKPLVFPHILEVEEMIEIRVPFDKFIEIMNSDQHFLKIKKPRMIRFKICVSEDNMESHKFYKANKNLEFPNNILREKFRYIKFCNHYYEHRDCKQCFKRISNYSKFPCRDWRNSTNAKTCYNFDSRKGLDLNIEYMSYKYKIMLLTRLLCFILYLIVILFCIYEITCFLKWT